MKFTKMQLAAIWNSGKLMILADGNVDEWEKKHMSITFGKLAVVNNVTIDEITSIEENMEAEDASSIVAQFTKEQKLYFLAFMGVLMAIDENIDPKEERLFRALANLYGYPNVTIKECFDVWKSLN